VEKIQKNFPKDSIDIQDLAASALLGMSARARAKGREGTKVNKGALFARINDVVDIEQAMRKEEVRHPERSQRREGGGEEREDRRSDGHRTSLYLPCSSSHRSKHLKLTHQCQILFSLNTAPYCGLVKWCQIM
jgi:hypothetical protein